MPDPTQDPSMGDPSDGSEQGGGFAVTVTDNGDGTYSVSQVEEQDESQDPSDPESGPQTAHSIEEACKMMEQMFKEESGEDASEPEDGEDPNAPLPADKAKSVWNQMASQKSKAAM